MYLGKEQGKRYSDAVSGSVPKRHVRHRVPLCRGLGSEPVVVKLVRVQKDILIVVKTNYWDVHLGSDGNCEPRARNLKKKSVDREHVLSKIISG